MFNLQDIIVIYNQLLLALFTAVLDSFNDRFSLSLVIGDTVIEYYDLGSLFVVAERLH